MGRILTIEEKIRCISQSMPALVNAFAGRLGIKVVFQGPPRTDNETIYLNPIPISLAKENPEKAEKITEMVLGDAKHECAHARYTNFTFLNTLSLGKFAFRIANSIEDTFVERRLGEDYLGARETLANSVEIAIEMGECRTGQHSPSDTILTYIDTWGRKFVLRQKVDEIFEPCKKRLEEILDEHSVFLIESLLNQQLHSVNSTEESFSATIKILQLLKDIKDQKTPPPPPENKNTSSNSDDDSEDAPGSGSSGNTEDDSKDTPDASSSGNSEDDSEDDPENSDSNGSDDSDLNDSGSKASKGMEEIMDDDVDDSAFVDRSKILKDMMDQMESRPFVFHEQSMRRAKLVKYNGCLKRAQNLEEQIGAEASMLRRRLASEFQTKTRCRAVDSDDGVLNRHRLHLAAAKKPTVFTRKTVCKIPYPAVELVCDISGSMNRRDIDLLVQATIATGTALSRMGIAFEIIAYEQENHYYVKSYRDRWGMNIMENLGCLTSGGGTPTAEALWVAGNNLYSRKEQRKLLILITDGGPNEPAHAKEVAQMLLASGIEVYGIGIGVNDNTMAQFCDNYGVISQSDQIATALLNALGKQIFK